MVEAAGLEPTMPVAGDLQSPGVTNFPIPPFNYYNTLPLCCQPAPNGRSDKGECVLKCTTHRLLPFDCSAIHFNTLGFLVSQERFHRLGRPFEACLECASGSRFPLTLLNFSDQCAKEDCSSLLLH